MRTIIVSSSKWRANWSEERNGESWIYFPLCVCVVLFSRWKWKQLRNVLSRIIFRASVNKLMCRISWIHERKYLRQFSPPKTYLSSWGLFVRCSGLGVANGMRLIRIREWVIRRLVWQLISNAKFFFSSLIFSHTHTYSTTRSLASKHYSSSTSWSFPMRTRATD